MRMLLVLVALVVTGALAVVGCGSSTDDSSSATPAESASATLTSDESAAITLPGGWTMADAISAQDVGSVTGKTMEEFAEASSAAQNGKPAGSFTATGVDGSKIYFGVDVQGGQSGYESMLSYATDGSAQSVSGVGDEASTVSFSDGRTGIIVRKGDAVIRIDWDPAVYKDDPADFGSSLANLLLSAMYR